MATPRFRQKPVFPVHEGTMMPKSMASQVALPTPSLADPQVMPPKDSR